MKPHVNSNLRQLGVKIYTSSPHFFDTSLQDMHQFECMSFCTPAKCLSEGFVKTSKEEFTLSEIRYFILFGFNEGLYCQTEVMNMAYEVEQ